MLRVKPLDHLTPADLWRACRPPGVPTRAVWERTPNFPPPLVIKGLIALAGACYSSGRPAVGKTPIPRPRGRALWPGSDDAPHCGVVPS